MCLSGIARFSGVIPVETQAAPALLLSVIPTEPFANRAAGFLVRCALTITLIDITSYA